MTAMQGKIPIENAMKHEWNMQNTRNSMLFEKQKIVYISLVLHKRPTQ